MKITKFMFALFLITGFVSAQAESEDRRRFEGKWNLIEIELPSSVKVADYSKYWMEISIAGEKLLIRRNVIFRGEITKWEDIYFLDKRGEVNETRSTIDKSIVLRNKSKTRLKKGIINIEYEADTQIIYEKNSNAVKSRERVRGRELYSVSEDGNRLIFERRQTYPDFRMKGGFNPRIKFIFAR